MLVGKEGTAVPRVTDTGIQIDGDEITVGLEHSSMDAKGDVTSVMQPASARGGTGQGRTPALLDAEQAVYASAAALSYDSEQRRGTYTGRARLWQGDTNIRAERIELDEQLGNLAADGGVQSTIALTARPGPSAGEPAKTGPPAEPSLGRRRCATTMRRERPPMPRPRG